MNIERAKRCVLKGQCKNIGKKCSVCEQFSNYVPRRKEEKDGK